MKVSDWKDIRKQVEESTRLEPCLGHKAKTLAMIDEEIALLEREAGKKAISVPG